MMLIVRNIRKDEVAEVSSILEEAALWMKRSGMEMWTEKQYSVSGLLDGYKVEDLYLGYIRNQAAATMVLQVEDPRLWPDERQPCLYLHKLAVRREYAGLGIAAEMIAWAKRQAHIRGKHYLRLDCAADRPKLCGFYEEQGFMKVREALVLGKYPTAFYELRVDR